MKLSLRLSTIAAYIPSGSKVADIGTDHAYLPVYLVKQGICPGVIAADIHNAPFQSALRTVESFCLGDKISVRLGDGLKVLRPGEVETIVIAGMGGNTMEQIFSRAPEVIKDVRRLVLQPMTDTEKIREWLWANGWILLDEDLVAEDGKLYEFLVAEPGREQPKDSLIGPRLIEKRHPLLTKLLEQKEKQLAGILAGVSKSTDSSTRAQIGELQEQLEKIEKVKKWLTAEQSAN
ncbi:class I SAM-dependent methyltransferase [Metallumcola ferriviriculae]|uniref:Class I SAM-dependent methyltransferase n=1 Tax=Metallumcola ferriviriculae TaxID=3039180 RepID=A0AAU0ULS8_9FIRM|nr:class I SAM-dependent methyltransferase [Desulfitibacteraceae bacterium MK1]